MRGIIIEKDNIIMSASDFLATWKFDIVSSEYHGKTITVVNMIKKTIIGKVKILPTPEGISIKKKTLIEDIEFKKG